MPPLPRDSDIQHPDYDGFIPVKETRRMNDILKMAITCSADCLQQAGLEQPEAIIVGTSMGCNHFTKTFLDKILEANGGLISPTAFMLSTHNTIAGQVSLFLGNRRHNMTHTHNSLSFEQALIDGALCIQEGARHVLVGAADEMENDLYDIYTRLNNPDLHVTCGATFFILSAEKPETPAVQLSGVDSGGLTDDLPGRIRAFLADQQSTAETISAVLYSSSNPATAQALLQVFRPEQLIDFQTETGVYYTNSAFALHIGMDRLKQQKTSGKVLICNNLIPENLGLMLLQ